MPPLLLVDGIHIPARLDAHGAARAPGGHAVHGGDVDGAPRVELKPGLGAQSLEVEFAARVVEGEEGVHGTLAGVEGDRGRVGVHDEAVVRVGLRGAEGEFFVRRDAREGGDFARRDVVGVGDLVQVRGDGRAGAFDRRAVGDVEVAFGFRWSAERGAECGKETTDRTCGSSR